MRALVYVKSAGPAQLVIPLIKLMQENGDDVRVIADAPAVDECKKHGIGLYFGGPTNKIAYDSFSPEAARDMMIGLDPDVLIAAPDGNPFMSERGLIEGATLASVPVVLMEDFWGVSNRISERANLYLVLDKYAEELVKKRRLGEHSARVIVMGNHAARAVTPSHEALRFMYGLKQRFAHVFCYLGGGTEATGPELKLLVQSLAMSDIGSWCLIPRFHPGYAKIPSPSGKIWRDVWYDELELPSDRLIFTEELETEDVVVLSDVSFGGNSTDFTKAICAGKRAISLLTEETQKSIEREQAPGRKVPMVALGLAEQITKPTDLAPLLTKPLSDSSKLKPYDPEVAYKAIQWLIGEVDELNEE